MGANDMSSTRAAIPITLSCLLLLAGFSVSASAQAADHWYLLVKATGSGAVIGSTIGMDPRAKDGYDGDPADGDLSLHPDPASAGVWLLYYRIQGPDWIGTTGLYDGDMELTPVPPGGSKTWSEFYLWAQNRAPISANLVMVKPQFSLPPPSGYRAHLVLDYVPVSCNWTGGPDVWINDLSANNTFALPIPLVTDPLQGTQFHIDVYAPAVPEPSSLAALLCGLVGVGGIVVRRRRSL